MTRLHAVIDKRYRCSVLELSSKNPTRGPSSKPQMIRSSHVIPSLILFLLSFLIGTNPVYAGGVMSHVNSYPSLFFEPNHVLNNAWFASNHWSHDMIRWWAGDLIQAGPWSVTNKTLVARSGNNQDYLSLAVYFWPNCSDAGNTTELTQEEIWDTCTYYQRDGIFNPDIDVTEDSYYFGNLSDSVYLSAMSYAATGSSIYSQHINDAIHTFFVNNKTAMNPNLNYGQVIRGPGNQTGRHTGVLDARGLTKIVSGVELMRASAAPEWSSETETGLVTWAQQQVQWLITNTLGQQEKAEPNNHGTFYYNQIVSLYILLNQTSDAVAALEEFYNTTFPGQIDANGDQPLESIRTRPFHYRAFNLNALTVNARLGDYVGLSPPGWNRTTSSGATMLDAINFAMAQDPVTAERNESSAHRELNPTIAAWISKMGDPTGNLTAYLKQTDPMYPRQPYYALCDGVSDSGLKQGIIQTTYNAVSSQPTGRSIQFAPGRRKRGLSALRRKG